MRKAVLRKQRETHGRRALAVLPIHYPKPLLTAMDILAVELWGPPGPPRGPAAGRLQAYICSLARNAVAFVAAGGADAVDGFLYPHTCDAIQGLATLIPDFGPSAKPGFHYRHPKGEMRVSSRNFVRAELQALAEKLAGLTGRELAAERLSWALGLHLEIDALRAELLDKRARLVMSDTTLYGLLRRGEFLWPEDYRDELLQATRKLGDKKATSGAPVLVTGIVPEPMTIFEALEEAGARVVADDYAAVGRRVIRGGVAEQGDPLDRLVDWMFAVPPCPTRTTAQTRRLRHLVDLYEKSGARGVIIHTVKFCEPELFDLPAIRRTFGGRGVPVLQLESELESEISGQTITRLEAFVEMVQSRKGGTP